MIIILINVTILISLTRHILSFTDLYFFSSILSYSYVKNKNILSGAHAYYKVLTKLTKYFAASGWQTTFLFTSKLNILLNTILAYHPESSRCLPKKECLILPHHEGVTQQILTPHYRPEKKILPETMSLTIIAQHDAISVSELCLLLFWKIKSYMYQ